MSDRDEIDDMRVDILKHVVSAPFEGNEYVLLDIESGTYFSMADTGGFLWSLWKSDGSVGHSVDRLVEEYAVERAQAEADVLALVDRLASQGLVSISTGPCTPPK